jgi:hypothetical protein
MRTGTVDDSEVEILDPFDGSCCAEAWTQAMGGLLGVNSIGFSDGPTEEEMASGKDMGARCKICGVCGKDWVKSTAHNKDIGSGVWYHFV